MMTALYLTGGVLLVVCGAGIGFLIARAEQNKWRTAHAFSRLLEYTGASIRYKGCPADEVLAGAAIYPEFARLGLDQCLRFSEIPVPGVFGTAVCQELRENLLALETCGKDSACKTLESMILLCQPGEDMLRDHAHNAMRLYPRLGGCFGALAAILLI